MNELFILSTQHKCVNIIHWIRFDSATPVLACLICAYIAYACLFIYFTMFIFLQVHCVLFNLINKIVLCYIFKIILAIATWLISKKDLTVAVRIQLFIA